MALGHRAQVQVVGDHGGDLHVQLALGMAVQQVGQTVVELAHHQQHAHRPGTAVQAPLHVEALGDIGKAGFQLRCVTRDTGVVAEHRAHEEAPVVLVVELRHLADVATVLGQVGGHRSDDAGHGRAADAQDEVIGSGMHVG
ncbi:hypothetical protein D3C78_990200 [compost metagenome]